MDAPQWNGEPGALLSDEDRHAPEYGDPMCPHCCALPHEDHHPQCPLYLPLCTVCHGPTKRDGELCFKCRTAA